MYIDILKEHLGEIELILRSLNRHKTKNLTVFVYLCDVWLSKRQHLDT
jgi:hypothetical protein